ncbi:hypothetical protein B0H63DRAFT_519253 [Podospora didyma]|uniref:Uncharacterized protein n=1 Tax=Podospora didyma TaxID=330526 RepID=A0AAE0NYR0_9PEZI|nr:hypothetical protein B0H63DRAFT_519253 [Podospora didyma]
MNKELHNLAFVCLEAKEEVKRAFKIFRKKKYDSTINPEQPAPSRNRKRRDCTAIPQDPAPHPDNVNEFDLNYLARMDMETTARPKIYEVLSAVQVHRPAGDRGRSGSLRRPECSDEKEAIPLRRSARLKRKRSVSTSGSDETTELIIISSSGSSIDAPSPPAASPLSPPSLVVNIKQTLLYSTPPFRCSLHGDKEPFKRLRAQFPHLQTIILSSWGHTWVTSEFKDHVALALGTMLGDESTEQASDTREETMVRTSRPSAARPGARKLPQSWPSADRIIPGKPKHIYLWQSMRFREDGDGNHPNVFILGHIE